MGEYYIDAFKPNIVDEIKNGVNYFEGSQRGIGVTGSRYPQILEGPIYVGAIEAMKGLSIVAPFRLRNIFLILKFYLNKECQQSDIIEFGSCRCGSAIFMAYVVSKLYPGMRIYALDTFEGMPETDRNVDFHTQGDFMSSDFDNIKNMLMNWVWIIWYWLKGHLKRLQREC